MKDIDRFPLRYYCNECLVQSYFRKTQRASPLSFR
ncbi:MULTISPECIES: zinc-finger domain-containing protein [Bacteroidales]